MFDKKNKPDSLSEQLIAIARYKKISQRKLAEKLGTSAQNLNNKLQNGNMREQDLLKLAEIIGCEFKIENKDIDM